MNEPQLSGDINAEAAAQVDNVQSEQYTSGEQQGNQVPLEALQAERAQRQGLQDELRIIKDHLGLLQAQQALNSQPAAREPMDSMSDDDVLTVGEDKRYLSKMNQQTQMSIQELKMTQQNPDYNDVVTKYLPEILKNNPKLRKTLVDTQDYELAYYLAKNSDAYKSSNKKERKNADAERIVQNSQNVGSLSSVGSASTMNTARKYKDMSDADFQKLANRNLGAF